MQQQQNPVVASEFATAVEAPVAGPVLLDLTQQALVSGGAPKGGWEIALVETDPAPKGGW